MWRVSLFLATVLFVLTWLCLDFSRLMAQASAGEVPIQDIHVKDPQIGFGDMINIARLSVSDNVTVTLHEDADGEPDLNVITSTYLAAGSYVDVVLQIPEDKQPLADTLYWIQVFQANSNTPSVSISVALYVTKSSPMPAVLEFQVAPMQVSDGSLITVTRFVVSQDVSLVVYQDNGGAPDPKALLSSGIFPGPDAYDNIQLHFSGNRRLQNDTKLWVGPITYNGTTNPSLLPINLVLKTEVTTFTAESHQSASGNFITVAALQATKPVTITLNQDVDGVPATATLDSEILAAGHLHRNVQLDIPQQPGIDTDYWVQVYAPESSEPYRVQKIHLDVPPVLHVRYRNLQVGDNSKIVVDEIQVSEPITLTLNEDNNSSPSSSVLTSTGIITSGTYETVTLSIPVASRPTADTTFWIRYLDIKGKEVYTPTSIVFAPANGSLPPVRDLQINQSQVGNGTMIAVGGLQALSPVTLTLHVDESGKPGAEPISALSLPAGAYPNSDHPILSLSIPEERQPVTDTLYWVRVFDSAQITAHASISVELKLLPVVLDLDVVSPQVGDGSAITITHLNVTHMVTVSISADDNGKPALVPITNTVLEAGDYQNTSLTLPVNLWPIQDTSYWIQVMSNRQTEPHRSALVELNLPPIIRLEVSPLQVGDGSFIEIAKLDASENIAVVLREDYQAVTTVTGAVVNTQTVLPGRHTALHVDILEERRPITDTSFAIDFMNSDQELIHPTVFVTLSVKAPPSIRPDIQVRDQERAGYNVVLDYVATDDNGWIAIYEKDGSSQHLVGYAKADKGEWKDFQVFFVNRQVPRGAVLQVVLHRDTGALGKFDYPEFDPLIKNMGEVVVQQFVMALPEILVQSGQIVSDAIEVDEVISSDAGWLAVYDAESKDVLGYTSVPMGRSTGVSVRFNAMQPPLGEHELVAVLHQNAGEPEVFEYPAPDIVSEYGNEIVHKTFSVTVESAQASATIAPSNLGESIPPPVSLPNTGKNLVSGQILGPIGVALTSMIVLISLTAFQTRKNK